MENAGLAYSLAERSSSSSVGILSIRKNQAMAGKIAKTLATGSGSMGTGWPGSHLRPMTRWALRRKRGLRTFRSYQSQDAILACLPKVATRSRRVLPRIG